MATARAPYAPGVIGADIGNATTVVANPDGTAAFFPSVLAQFVGRYDGMPVSGTTRHHIDYGEMHAVIGGDALEMVGSDTILNDTQPAYVRYTEPVSLLCFLAGISAAYPAADVVGVKLATGAPLSIFEAHGADIARRYNGTHEYGYNGKSRRVVVDTVRIYGEGREAWRLMAEQDRRGNVAVHDIGGKTWNVLLFKDGALRGHRTFDLGIERLLDQVPAVPRDAAARWSVQQEMRRNPKAHAEIRASLEKVIGKALDQIERKINLPAAERHALIGGGAVYLSSVIKRRYNAPALILNGDAPEAANAIAYAMALASEV